MARNYVHLTYEQRQKIEDMLRKDLPKRCIAEELGVHVATVYREIERGTNGGRYDPDYAERMYQARLAEKGAPAKIEENPELAQYIADLILKQKMSPEKIAEEIKKNEKNLGVSITKQTIYHNIEMGIVPGVTKDTLRTDSSTIFGDGQICIPKWVREKLELRDGDVLDLRVTEDGEIVYKRRESKTL